MSQFTVYKSSDSGAPALTGAVGSFINVLNYILVGGQGGNSAGIAYGIVPSAGWTQAYTGTNLVAYRAGLNATTGHGTQFYLYINDNAPTGNGTANWGARGCRLCGYETMSSISTGFGQFPNPNYNQGVYQQGANGYGFLTFVKSATQDSAARTWIAYADPTTLYFFALNGGAAGIYSALVFGDFYAYSSIDKWNCILIANSLDNVTNTNIVSNYEAFEYQGWANTAIVPAGGSYPNHYCPRNYAGAGYSIAMSKHGDWYKGGASNYMGLSGMTAPNPVDGAYYISPIYVSDPSATGNLRGQMRGLWQLCHPVATFSDGTAVTGSGPFAGQTFTYTKTFGNGGGLLLETSNTLLTN